jgi:hypothetical protein
MPPHVDEVKAQALGSGMSSPKPPPPPPERRGRRRSDRENQTTGLVQMILLDPGAAGDMLEKDIKEGGSAEVVLGLLDAAEAVFSLRGIDAGAKLAALRQRLKRYTG